MIIRYILKHDHGCQVEDLAYRQEELVSVPLDYAYKQAYDPRQSSTVEDEECNGQCFNLHWTIRVKLLAVAQVMLGWVALCHGLMYIKEALRSDHRNCTNNVHFKHQSFLPLDHLLILLRKLVVLAEK